MEDNVNVRMTKNQKKALCRQADLAGKKLSVYAREVLLAQSLDTVKMEFYQSINENLLELQRSNYVVTRMLLLLGTEVMKDEDSVIQFYKEIVTEAENRFKKE